MGGEKYTMLTRISVSSYINFRQRRLQDKEKYQAQREVSYNNKGVDSPRTRNNF